MVSRGNMALLEIVSLGHPGTNKYGFLENSGPFREGFKLNSCNISYGFLGHPGTFRDSFLGHSGNIRDGFL